MSNPKKDITEGIDSLVLRSLHKSIDNNSKEMFSVISEFIKKILSLSINSNSINEFRSYIYFPSYYYYISHRSSKKNILIQDLHKFCSENAASTLKDIVWYSYSINKNTSLDNLKELNKFYNLAFTSFSQLFYYIVKNSDIEILNSTMIEYNYLTKSANNVYYEYRREIFRLKDDNLDGENDLKIKNLKDSFIVTNQYSSYVRHVLLGVEYWVYFLFSVNEINEKVADQIIDLINNSINSKEEFLKDIIFFRSNNNNYLNWGEWDYIDRPSGEVYSPPVPYDWLTLGFMADLIRYNNFYIDINSLDIEEANSTRFLFDNLKENGDYFKENFELWKNILKVKSIEELEEKIRVILSLIIQIKQRAIEAEERITVNLPINEGKVSDFKQSVGSAWLSNSKIRKIFKKYNAVEIVDNKTILDPILLRRFIRKGKTMFIEDPNFNWIHGVDTFGAEIARREDDKFFYLLFKQNNNTIEGENIIEALDNSLKYFSDKNIVPTLIILPQEYSHRFFSLLTNSRFVRMQNLPKAEVEDISFLFGKFDNVPIYFTNSNLLNNQIVVSNFEKAFKMKYKSNNTWFENELDINVIEVDDAEAHNRLEKDPTKWKNIENGIVLSDDDALILIKNSINIELRLEVDFNIIDEDFYIIGSIKS